MVLSQIVAALPHLMWCHWERDVFASPTKQRGLCRWLQVSFWYAGVKCSSQECPGRELKRERRVFLLYLLFSLRRAYLLKSHPSHFLSSTSNYHQAEELCSVRRGNMSSPFQLSEICQYTEWSWGYLMLFSPKDQRQLEEERMYLSYISLSLLVVEESQDRNSEQKSGSRNQSREHGERTLTNWISSPFSYLPGPTAKKWDDLHQSTIKKKMPHRHFHRPN